jgi:hypothetical protein
MLPRQRGGQPGNRNARVHGHYSIGLDTGLKPSFERQEK